MNLPCALTLEHANLFGHCSQDCGLPWFANAQGEQVAMAYINTREPASLTNQPKCVNNNIYRVLTFPANLSFLRTTVTPLDEDHWPYDDGVRAC